MMNDLSLCSIESSKFKRGGDPNISAPDVYRGACRS